MGFEVITKMSVEFDTELSDSFDEEPTEESAREAAEDHIDDWCWEHKIDKDLVCYKIFMPDGRELKEDKSLKIIRTMEDFVYKFKNKPFHLLDVNILLNKLDVLRDES